VRCSGGIAPGPVEGQVIVRGALGAEENCEYYRARIYNGAGLSTSTGGGLGSPQLGLGAIVGPLTIVLGSQDQAAEVGRCATPGEPWTNCESLATNVYSSLVGFAADYNAGRILPLSRGSALFDLTTGNVVANLPTDDPPLYYKAAAFSGSGDTLYAAASVEGLFGANGKLFALAADDGQLLDEIDVSDGMPLAVAVDDPGKRILVIIADLNEDRVWLRVYSRLDHTVVIDVPLDNPTVAAAVSSHTHHLLIFDHERREATLVSTDRVRYFQNTPINPMAIARWTLP
jgi:hypothetical protein